MELAPRTSPLTGLAALPLDLWATAIEALPAEQVEEVCSKLDRENPQELTGLRRVLYYNRLLPLLLPLGLLTALIVLPALPNSLNPLVGLALIGSIVWYVKRKPRKREPEKAVATPLAIRRELFHQTGCSTQLRLRADASLLQKVGALPAGEEHYVEHEVSLTAAGGWPLSFGSYAYVTGGKKKRTVRKLSYLWLPFATPQAIPAVRAVPSYREPLGDVSLSAAFSRQYSVHLAQDDLPHRLFATKIFTPDVQELLLSNGTTFDLAVAVAAEGVLITGSMGLEECAVARPLPSTRVAKPVLLSALVAQEVLEQLSPAYKMFTAEKREARALFQR